MITETEYVVKIELDAYDDHFVEDETYDLKLIIQKALGPFMEFGPDIDIAHSNYRPTSVKVEMGDEVPPQGWQKWLERFVNIIRDRWGRTVKAKLEVEEIVKQEDYYSAEAIKKEKFVVSAEILQTCQMVIEAESQAEAIRLVQSGQGKVLGEVTLVAHNPMAWSVRKYVESFAEKVPPATPASEPQTCGTLPEDTKE